jgi:hypothetical protein
LHSRGCFPRRHTFASDDEKQAKVKAMREAFVKDALPAHMKSLSDEVRRRRHPPATLHSPHMVHSLCFINVPTLIVCPAYLPVSLPRLAPSSAARAPQSPTLRSSSSWISLPRATSIMFQKTSSLRSRRSSRGSIASRPCRSSVGRSGDRMISGARPQAEK